MDRSASSHNAFCASVADATVSRRLRKLRLVTWQGVPGGNRVAFAPAAVKSGYDWS